MSDKVDDNKLSLYQKIQAVAMELKTLRKDKTVGTGKSEYKAISDLIVTKSVKAAESKYGIISIPIKQELVSGETIRIVEGQCEKIRYSFIIKMTVRIINIDNPNEHIDIETFGHGLDSGDKGFGKASTYARKYALLNAYKIATGEDADDNPSGEDKAPLSISEKRKAITEFLYKDNRILQNVLKRFSVGQLEDLTEKEVEIVYDGFHKKGQL